MIRARLLALTFPIAVLILGAASSAHAGSTRIAFTHSYGLPIADFRAQVGFSSGNYAFEISLGLPSVTPTVFIADIDIPDDVEVFVAVVAVDADGVRSAPSNEQVRFIASSPLGPPGQPQLIE